MFRCAFAQPLSIAQAPATRATQAGPGLQGPDFAFPQTHSRVGDPACVDPEMTAGRVHPLRERNRCGRLDGAVQGGHHARAEATVRERRKQMHRTWPGGNGIRGFSKDQGSREAHFSTHLLAGSMVCGSCGATIAQVSGKSGGYCGCLAATKGHATTRRSSAGRWPRR